MEIPYRMNECTTGMYINDDDEWTTEPQCYEEHYYMFFKVYKFIAHFKL